MLSTHQLALMSDAQDLAMPDTCAIERWVYESDGIGGTRRTATRTVIAASVASRWTPGQQEGQLGQAQRELEIQHWTVRFPLGTTIADEDVLVRDSRDFRVMRLKDPKSYETVITVEAIEVI